MGKVPNRLWKSIWIYSLWAIVFVGCQSQVETQPPTSQSQTETSNDVSALNWKIPSFSAVDHAGKKFTQEDLQKGKLWLVDMIFTRCNNICPPMTANMAKVQQELKKQNLDVKILSFTVDPDHDQPKVLQEFAKKYHADLNGWHFLTGYSLKEIQNISEGAFKTTVTHREGPTEEVPIMVDHSSRFFLVNDEGKVLRFYDGLKPDGQQIAKDVKQILGQSGQ